MKRLINFRPLLFVFAGLALGIRFSRDIFRGDILIISLFSILTIFLVLVSVFRKSYKALCCLLIPFALGLGLFFLEYHNFQGDIYNGNVLVEGRLSKEVLASQNYDDVVLTNVKLNGKANKNICLIIKADKTIKQGTLVKFEGEIKNYELFDFAKFNSYIYKNNTPYYAYLTSSKGQFTQGPLTITETIKNSVKAILEQNMSESGAELSYSVLFGDKAELDKDVQISFADSGVAHLLAVSGLHVGFIATILYIVLGKLKCKNWLRFLITTVFLLAFCFCRTSSWN